MADARRLDFHQNLAGLRSLEIKFDNLQWLLGLECNRGFRLHRKMAPSGALIARRSGDALEK